MSTDTVITYRPLHEDDIPAAHALTQAVRWPHRIEDWQAVVRLGSGVAALDNGAVVGTALWWAQGERQASLGMVIVAATHQGRGIGRELMQRVLDQTGTRQTLLIATPAGQPLYERLGFAATGTIHQHQGTMQPVDPPPGAGHVRLAEPRELGTLVDLANRATGRSRDAIVKHLAQVGEAAVLERGGAIAGFSIMRRFGRGHVIGPLVAPDADGARALVAFWSAAYADTFVRLDVTGAAGLGPWLEQAGLAEVDTGVAMARNGEPRHDATLLQFAIVNQALC